MEAITQHEIDENIKNFHRDITQVLSEPYQLNIDHDDEGLPFEASIWTREEIDVSRTRLLDDHAQNWNLKLSFSATSTGRLSINFKQIQD